MPIPLHSQLAAWLADNRIRLLDALAAALDTDVVDVLRRLGIRFRDLVIEAAPASSRPRRLRGRPRRRIDRERVLSAMRRHCGRPRPVSRDTQIPRSTLTRFMARVPAHAWIYGELIAEHHGALLAKSDVSVEVARARGYVSGPDGLVVPIWNERGVKVWTQVRLDEPKDRRHRYRNSPDAEATIDLNPCARQLVLDPDRPLHITESPRKADAAVSRGLACVAFPGIRMLCLDAERWRYIGVEGREVRIVFDGDAARKPDVRDAELQIATFLRSLSARVRIIRLPGEKTGLDDFLAAGHDEADLVTLTR